MVRTLANAITSGRLAHAFILTGIRGVGKTTTARIIARALNCIGADGTGGPTPDPCGTCDHCTSIGEDRHVDVIEMDAASRTGVDDIRELIEGVRYRPVSARFKIYIIDEVHMLSRNAFNALLKTLEEPPEHVKFIFATTEIRKVPVTVLSRCQRFDLRRVDGETLFSHLEAVAGREGVEIAEDALRQIVRAAEGSVRDALSPARSDDRPCRGRAHRRRPGAQHAGPRRPHADSRFARGPDARAGRARSRRLRCAVRGGRGSDRGSSGSAGVHALADPAQGRAGGYEGGRRRLGHRA